MAAESLGLSHTGPLSIVPSVPPAQDAPPSQAHACTAEPCAEGAVPGVVREAIRKAVQGAVQEATPGAVPAEQRRCPACGGAQVVRHGSFRMASGQRVQRYLCKTCRRTFSPNTGTPAYRIRKQEQWREMIDLLVDDLPLRQVASCLGIALSTAFYWRHRALAALSARPREKLSGDVRVETFRVKYSEKGSRTTNGPGSWGYWNIVRRGIGPGGPMRPGLAPAGRNGFRLLIDGRPVSVMVAETDSGYELGILGQGRRTPDLVGEGLSRMVRPGSRVYAFGGSEYEKACEMLGYEYRDGIAAVSMCAGSTAGEAQAEEAQAEEAQAGEEQAGDVRAGEALHEPVLGEADAVGTGTAETCTGETSTGETGAGETGAAGEASAGPIRFPNLPTWWLRQFRGVATKYLVHYLAWFRDIVRIVQYPDGANIAPVDGRALLRSPAC